MVRRTIRSSPYEGLDCLPIDFRSIHNDRVLLQNIIVAVLPCIQLYVSVGASHVSQSLLFGLCIIIDDGYTPMQLLVLSRRLSLA
mmetsp:Transcript_13441/g.16931  ORF Transcript_13441/g.16931 Transcript_13441/m.16931 type:complete len:85 (+) Transcript_13441:341-595(+)